ncbi:hypothetical protein LC593_08490 [Nostoc sp. CHAB 5844]|nr:hypothetical protein [Nostoc sp. CHAB 5844]
MLKRKFYPRKLLLTSIGLLAIAYISTCLFLFLRQRYIIFRPTTQILTLPNSRDFNLPYEEVRFRLFSISN